MLSLNNCAEISSLKFIQKMKSLEDLRFVKTNVKDGDLSYCEGLKYVGFLPKRHYSHKPENFIE